MPRLTRPSIAPDAAKDRRVDPREIEVSQLTDRGASAVATDKVEGSEFTLSRGGVEDDLRVRVVVIQGGDCVVAEQLDAEARGVVGQKLLQLGLPDQGRYPVLFAVHRAVDLVDPRKMGVVTAHVAAIVTLSALVARLELGAQAPSPQRLSGQDPDPTSLLQGVGLSQLFDHDGVDSGDLQLGCQRQPDGPGPDNEDLTVNLHFLHFVFN